MTDHHIKTVIRGLRRLVNVLRILRRHGILGMLRGDGHWPRPEQVRAALEELGVVFIKFGQVAALRRDILPDAYVEEMERLHDRLAPMPFPVVKETVEVELRSPVGVLFEDFTEEPLAAATIAQVHAATLAGGQHVVVKVRRRGLERRIEEDTAVLAFVATLAENVVPGLRAFDLAAFVDEFRRTLRQEMDFRREAQNVSRFRESLRDVGGVWIPGVVHEYSTEAVLTLEHSPGERIDRYVMAHPDRAGDLAEAVAALVLRQVFEDGLFHADPHPGNLFVLPDGRLCLHDFGMIGELSPRMREALVDLLAAEVQGDTHAAVDAYLRLGMPGDDVERERLEREFEVVLADLRDRSLDELSIGQELQRLLRVATRNRIRNPREVMLLVRAFLIAEALLRRLDPHINIIQVFQAQLGRMSTQRLRPDRVLDEARAAAHDIEALMRTLPHDLRAALRRIADGDMGRVHTVGVDAGLDRMRASMDRLSRMMASIGVLIAGALLAGSGGWPRDLGYGLVALGFAGLAVLALQELRDAWVRPGGRNPPSRRR